jgi:excisionase family DNA binding protein
MTNKKFLTSTEACNYLGISKSTLYKKTYSGILAHYKPNNKLLYFEQETLDNYITSVYIESVEDIKSKQFLKLR